MNDKPHSQDFLNDVRDHWWNADFIALMAKRWELSTVQSMLDVGCGIGHWGQMLLPHLASNATMIGIDPENEWIEQAYIRAKNKNIAHRVEYLKASVEMLPFPDNSFDMVTCQTVLIHVKDISHAIHEMLRVLKPGGLLAVAEPNNSISTLIFNNLNINIPIDEVLDSVRFQLIYERGKAALHEGHNSYGDIIPWYFYQVGLQDVKVYLSDLADYFIPPYRSAREQATIAAEKIPSELEWEEAKAEFQRHFLAGGGILAEFERLWPNVIKRTEQVVKGHQDKNLCSAGGLILYLISGRKK